MACLVSKNCQPFFLSLWGQELCYGWSSCVLKRLCCVQPSSFNTDPSECLFKPSFLTFCTIVPLLHCCVNFAKNHMAKINLEIISHLIRSQHDMVEVISVTHRRIFPERFQQIAKLAKFFKYVIFCSSLRLFGFPLCWGEVTRTGNTSLMHC